MSFKIVLQVATLLALHVASPTENGFASASTAVQIGNLNSSSESDNDTNDERGPSNRKFRGLLLGSRRSKYYSNGIPVEENEEYLPNAPAPPPASHGWRRLEEGAPINVNQPTPPPVTDEPTIPPTESTTKIPTTTPTDREPTDETTIDVVTDEDEPSGLINIAPISTFLPVTDVMDGPTDAPTITFLPTVTFAPTAKVTPAPSTDVPTIPPTESTTKTPTTTPTDPLPTKRPTTAFPTENPTEFPTTIQQATEASGGCAFHFRWVAVTVAIAGSFMFLR